MGREHATRGEADIQHPRRTVLATFVVLLTGAGMLAGAPPAAAAASCFGHRPTITGTSGHAPCPARRAAT